jgi:group II intron reverse transcriptase/maturase
MMKTKPFTISKWQVATAFELVKANAGSSGIDQQSIQDFERNLQNNLYKLWNRLSSGSYYPPPGKAVAIPKKTGGERVLGIPTVGDRVAQMVVKLEFDPQVEPYFSEDSYGYRPNKSAIDAIGITRQRCWRYDWVLEFDIKGMFDNIPHGLLLKAVEKHTEIRWVRLNIERWLTAPMETANGESVARTKGTPQGGVISPLLANIVLNKLDWRLDQAGYRFVRYADDFVVVCKDRQQAEAALDWVETIMTELGLALSPEKTKIASYGKGYEFLGFRLSSKSRTMRPKSLEKFKTKVRDITRRSNNLDSDVIMKLNRVIRGTANYFATDFSTCIWLFQQLDKWIRMRLRCMKFKRKSDCDNYRLRQGTFDKKLGLLKMLSFTKTSMCTT